MISCTKCGESKDENSYYAKADGRRYRHCKSCHNKMTLAWSQSNAEARAAHSRAWRERHPDRNRESHRRANIRRRTSVENFERMLADQDGVCAICRQPCKTGRQLAIDHCHATGTVRGLLCGNCNKGLGNFQDDPHLLATAIDYLARAVT